MNTALSNTLKLLQKRQPIVSDLDPVLVSHNLASTFYFNILKYYIFEDDIWVEMERYGKPLP